LSPRRETALSGQRRDGLDLDQYVRLAEGDDADQGDRAHEICY